MAEGDAVAEGTSGGLKFLTQKVGPLPLGVWIIAAVGIWWYLNRKNSGTAATIDPATGFPAGSPQDQQALQSLADQGSTAGSSGSEPSGPTGGYADNEAWGRAAINYLVGLGIDPTTANQAVQNYLSSQVLTSAQQGDVNLAIQALGPPPNLPGPVATNPPPVTTPPGGGGGGSGGGGGGKPPVTTPTVRNGKVDSVTNNTAVVSWQGTGASSWSTQIVGPGPINGRKGTVRIPQATYTGLEAGHDYTVTVQPLVSGKPAGTPGTIDIRTKGGKR